MTPLPTRKRCIPMGHETSRKTAEKETAVPEPVTNESPRVPARVQQGRAAWTLTVSCPHCHKTHKHGGGPVEEPPSGGHRLAHCSGSLGRGYTIDTKADVVDAEAPGP